MEAGHIVEVGTPYELLHTVNSNSNSSSSSSTSGHFLKLVNELGPELLAAVKARVTAHYRRGSRFALEDKFAL
jgi:hypothetical protein